MVEYKQESSEFIRYQYSYRKVGDTLPSYPVYEYTVVGGGREDTMAAQLSASPGEATGWEGMRSSMRRKSGD